MPRYEGDLRATEGARFAILASRWNPRITDALVAGAHKAFVDNGVAEAAVDVIRVPGAWELPLAAARIGAAWMTLRVKGRDITWHNGATGGFRTWAGLDREAGTGVVLLSATAVTVDRQGFRMLRELTERVS